MKRTLYRIMAVLITASVFFAACTKEAQDVKLDPKLSTSQLLNVTSDGATVVGFVVAAGNGFTERGICYNTATAPTIANSKAIYTGAITGATFNVVLSGLKYKTKYFVRAYATNSDNVTIYGEEYSFTTLPIVPELSTMAITAISGNTASGGGMVLVDGGDPVTVHGIVFGTKPGPTIADSKTTDGNAAGPYVSSLINLKGNTFYFVRAYATNSAGTGYGPEVSFTTLVALPVVTTTAVTGITKVAAISGGEVTDDGGGTITARGIVWSLNANPTLADNTIAGGTGTGKFVSNITGLTKYTPYHVRAYATNKAGTAYGADVAFTTLADILTWYVPGDYLAASYPGGIYADWSPAKSPIIMSTIANPYLLEGYIYMSKTSNQWKCVSDPDWNHTNYGASATPGVFSTDNGAGNIVSPAGYYKINATYVEGGSSTYTNVATLWGVIGGATPGDWNDETPLTYDPALQTWRGAMHLKPGEFKFRANHSWDYNYGSTKKDATLDAGGSNISTPSKFEESDAYFILDLSHPNAYTYSMNSWGLIGGGIPVTGWDSDHDLTWNAANKVFEITIALNAGDIKFRANNDWAVNLGGDINGLTQDGANISVASAGTYHITLDLSKDKPVCKISPSKKK
jgi:starch-binding outer membrane protein SusE/F